MALPQRLWKRKHNETLPPSHPTAYFQFLNPRRLYHVLETQHPCPCLGQWKRCRTLCRTFPPDLFRSRQYQRNPLVDKSLGCYRREWGCLDTRLKRRARESNPQRLTPHLISSQAANHSRTLRKCLRNTILRHLLLAVKGLFALCAQQARKDDVATPEEVPAILDAVADHYRESASTLIGRMAG